VSLLWVRVASSDPASIAISPASNADHPNVDHYRSGGIGHQDGDETKSVVGMVPTHVVDRYREHNGTWDDTYGGSGMMHDAERAKIESIKDDIRSGKGITNPLQLEYDHKEKWGSLGEGNHRLAAAREMGVSHVPVRVYGRAHLATDEGTGAPLHLSTDFGRGGHAYVPPDIHPNHFEELKP
jgi:hypothetical protein